MRRHRGHYFFHALFRDAVELGDLFDDLTPGDAALKHRGDGPADPIRDLLFLIDAVNLAVLQEIAGELLGESTSAYIS